MGAVRAAASLRSQRGGDDEEAADEAAANAPAVQQRGERDVPDRVRAAAARRAGTVRDGDSIGTVLAGQSARRDVCLVRVFVENKAVLHD